MDMTTKEFWEYFDTFSVSNTVFTASERLEAIKNLHKCILNLVPETLYRFQSVGSKYTESNLTNDNCYLNPVFSMNDINEAVGYLDKEGIIASLKKAQELLSADLPGMVGEAFYELYPETRNHPELFADPKFIAWVKSYTGNLADRVSKDYLTLFSDFYVLCKGFFGEWRLACFTETWKSDSMQALYGARSSGYVLEYETKDLLIEEPDLTKWTFSNLGFKTLLLPVRYSQRKQNLNDVFISYMMNRDANELFSGVGVVSLDPLFLIRSICSKSLEFSNEREWRIISPPEESHPLSIRPRSLILLPRMSDEKEKQIKGCISGKGITVYRSVENFLSPDYCQYVLLPR